MFNMFNNRDYTMYVATYLFIGAFIPQISYQTVLTISVLSKVQRAKLAKFFPVNMLGNSLKPADAVRNQGVWFDADLTFSKHVRMICKSCFGHVRDLRRLSIELLQFFVQEPFFIQHEKITNCTKQSCYQTTRHTHILPVRKKLHWLPIEYRCVYKTALLVYKFIHSGTPISHPTSNL